MRSSHLWSLALLVAFAGGARAQDGGLRPADDKGPAVPAPATDPVAPPAPTPPAAPQPPQAPNAPQAPSTADTPTVDGQPKDPGNWKTPTPPPGAAGVPEQDPLAQKPAPAPVDPAQEEADRRRNDRIIDNNYNQAIKIYDQVLSNDGETVDNLDHRIQTNEKLVATYKARLAQANELKRRQQVELFNRTFYLKQQRDKGAIPEDTFDKLMKQEEKKYNEKTAQARDDIQFYEKEIGDAEKRLNDLRAERRISVATTATTKVINGNKARKPPVKQSARVVNSLKDRLQRLSEFEPKHTMDGAPICEPCLETPAGVRGGAQPEPQPEPAVEK